MIFKNQEKIRQDKGRADVILERAQAIKSEYDSLNLPELSPGKWGWVLSQKKNMHVALNGAVKDAIQESVSQYVKVDYPDTSSLARLTKRLENYLQQREFWPLLSVLEGCKENGLKKAEDFDKQIETRHTYEANQEEIKVHRLVKDLQKTIDELKKHSSFKWYGDGRDILTDPLLNNMVVDGFNLEQYRKIQKPVTMDLAG